MAVPSSFLIVLSTIPHTPCTSLRVTVVVRRELTPVATRLLATPSISVAERMAHLLLRRTRIRVQLHRG